MKPQQNFDAYEEHRVLMNAHAEKDKDSWHPECSEIIKTFLPQTRFKNTVDIACCGGSTLDTIGVSGENLTLLDFAEKQLEKAKNRLAPKFKNISLVHADLTKEPEKILSNAPYDLVVCSHIIQHIEDEQKASRIAQVALKALGQGAVFVFVCYRRRPVFPFIPLPEKREGFFTHKELGLRIFYRRYVKEEILAMFSELECLGIDDKSKAGDIVFVGRKK